MQICNHLKINQFSLTYADPKREDLAELGVQVQPRFIRGREGEILVKPPEQANVQHLQPDQRNCEESYESSQETLVH